MKSIHMVSALALVALCCTLSACSSTTVRYRNSGSVETAKRHGPPPHAPAHGYRHKHGNVVLVYDSVLEVYVVSGHTDYYFHKDRYYRSLNSGWEISAQIDGSWKSISTKKLPKGLRNSTQAKNNKNKKK